jgi:hypothetical protein
MLGSVPVPASREDPQPLAQKSFLQMDKMGFRMCLVGPFVPRCL